MIWQENKLPTTIKGTGIEVNSLGIEITFPSEILQIKKRN